MYVCHMCAVPLEAKKRCKIHGTGIQMLVSCHVDAEEGMQVLFHRYTCHLPRPFASVVLETVLFIPSHSHQLFASLGPLHHQNVKLCTIKTSLHSSRPALMIDTIPLCVLEFECCKYFWYILLRMVSSSSIIVTIYVL